MSKLVRITTIPMSLQTLIKGQAKFMKSQGFEVVLASSVGPRIDELVRDEECRHVILPLSRELTPFKDLISLWKVYQFLRKEKPEIVHTHTPKAGIVGMLAAKLAGVKVRMHTIAGLPLVEEVGFKRKLLEKVELLTYWAATNVYPNSFSLQKLMKSTFYPSGKKLKILGNGTSNGINTEFFSPLNHNKEDLDTLRTELKIQANDFVYVFVGRINKDKGINELVAAFKTLNSQKKNVKLLLVGPYEKELDPLTDSTVLELESNPNIISVGFQKDIRPYLAVSDVLTFPSYREGFPNVPMQAGCYNLGLILSDINGCDEVVTNNENGVLIPAKDEKALLNAMQLLLENEETLKNYQSKIRTSIVKRYDQKYLWQELLKEYNLLLQKKGANV